MHSALADFRIEDDSVTVYTTGTCAYCRAEKAWLQQHKVPYTEVRVDADEAAAARMIELSGQANVPLTVVRRSGSEEQVAGFDQPRLTAALGL